MNRAIRLYPENCGGSSRAIYQRMPEQSYRGLGIPLARFCELRVPYVDPWIPAEMQQSCFWSALHNHNHIIPDLVHFTDTYKGYIDLSNFQPVPESQWLGMGLDSDTSPLNSSDNPLTPESTQTDSDGAEVRKRRKVVGGLRLQPAVSALNHSLSAELNADTRNNTIGTHNGQEFESTTSCRQVHSSTRFPLRKARKDSGPTIQASSADKLISGIWRQIYSGAQLKPPKSACLFGNESNISIRGLVDRETFLAINAVCLKYYTLSQSSRSLEMILQAYWVECYEARIDAIKLEHPEKSATESRMQALKEACSILQWKEKELRNKLSIWRGYKEIKEAGGWVSLIFASTGVYRICKYRTGFDEGLTPRLKQLRSSFEVAADTLHPQWRDFLEIIGQQSPRRYSGHPHDWVIMTTGPAVKLSATYARMIPDFSFRFIDESVVDATVFPERDPRIAPGIDPNFCHDCGQRQSNDVQVNRCMCFPTLYGSSKSPAPVQVFHTLNGRHNGVVARCDFERGTAIGEFIGYVTTGISDVDVMIGGSPERQYQIFQGKMGNFTRFINHSCRPNSQFQRFYWLGVERIIVVSRGIQAGTEITTDYSNFYWESLDKTCLCGELCCRYSNP
ncbi:hypothetical protein AJ80_01514 [Polytolypa hystricis UAMH7299]|uniref:SET domain-containing protein n=1 Tax=Polytolypa hystricis (strain UAMH7299) TaxID=1447883 RepID=A0A2B7Z011_POLH7|nr:hypothetical protein AJ80_01514 [Polytolypa hystricis UAMH7299]